MSEAARAYRGTACVAAIAITALLAATGSARAVGTELWSSEGLEEFMQGECRNAVITSQGEIAPGPAVEALARTGESYLWAIEDAGNGTLQLATGTHGRLLARDARGAIDTLRSSVGEDEIFAMTRARGGLVYGVSPSGLLLLAKGPGVPDTLASFEDRYIWSILARPSGELIVATGQPGRVWRLPAGGARQPELLFDSEEEHVLSLAAGADGVVYAGTGDRGLLYEIRPGGEARVLFDAPQKELRAIVPLGGGALAVAGSGPAAQDAGDDDGEGEGESEGGPARDAGGSGGGSGGAAAGAQAPPAVYRVRADGTVERIWRSPEAIIGAMAGEPGGTLLVGTGNRGRVYRLSPDAEDMASLVATLEEPQVVSILAGAKESLAGTANPATLYRIGGAPSGGEFTSRVFDATQISRWGTLRYDLASGAPRGLRFESRSGNVAEPGKGWSDWTPVRETGEGEGGTIASPAARYLQWRVRLDGAAVSTRIARVRIAWLPPNLAPRITRLSVSAGGAAGGASAPSGPPSLQQVLPSGVEVQYSAPRQAPQAEGPDPAPWTLTYRTADWEVSNPDQDALTFRLYYRSEEDRDWRLLSDAVESPAHTWNTSSFPDGLYRLKLVATDSTANPPGTARSSERTSALFRVDHTAPEITRLEFRRDGEELVIGATGRDAGGIAGAGYAVDGDDWRELTPEDGIFDENEESFAGRIGRAGPGEHVIVVRVLDETGNGTVRRATVSR